MTNPQHPLTESPFETSVTDPNEWLTSSLAEVSAGQASNDESSPLSARHTGAGRASVQWAQSLAEPAFPTRSLGGSVDEPRKEPPNGPKEVLVDMHAGPLKDGNSS